MGATRNLRIGLALGGGGAKGIAHIGVLKVFEEYGIKFSAIAGTSAGSLIAAGHALGLSSDEFIRRSKDFVTKKFTRISNFRVFSDSLIKDGDINDAIKDIVGENTTEADLKIPFLATAIDLESGKEIVLTKGKLWEIVRASSALPFIFSPVFLDEHYLVDGGLLNNVPVDHLREQHDLDLIIGVEVGGMTSKQFISGMVWEKYYKKPKSFELAPSFLEKMRTNITLMASIMLRSIDIMRDVSQQARYDKARPDMIIRLNMEDISLLEFKRYQESVQIGMAAAQKVIPDVLKMIEDKKRQLMMPSGVPNGDVDVGEEPKQS